MSARQTAGPARPNVPLSLADADTSALVEAARELVAEYAALPHAAPRWPTAAAEIAALPAPYVPPAGALLVATLDDMPVGCGALLALEPTIAEIKRVYVRPAARGRGVGEAITRALVARAAALGATRVRLDTAPELTAAQALYERLGFVRIPRYRTGLLPDAVCYERAVHTRVPPV